MGRVPSAGMFVGRVVIILGVIAALIINMTNMTNHKITDGSRELDLDDIKTNLMGLVKTISLFGTLDWKESWCDTLTVKQFEKSLNRTINKETNTKFNDTKRHAIRAILNYSLFFDMNDWNFEFLFRQNSDMECSV